MHLDDGLVPIDNNDTEQLMMQRPWAGRTRCLSAAFMPETDRLICSRS
jgi:hypothetical protein